MNTALQIQTRQPKISFIQIFLLILFSVAVFILIHWFGVEPANTSASSVFGYEEATELAEEIYEAGAITQAVHNLPIESTLLAKMISEIEGILKKTTDLPNCQLYFLYVIESGHYPVLGYGNAILGFEVMNSGEVWKVGQTCNSQEGRYPNNTFYHLKDINLRLTKEELQYVPIATGNQKKILILEKLLIYTYPAWSGHPNLIKPPGCRIYR